MSEENSDGSGFLLDEFLYRYRFPLLFILIGLIILGVGLFYLKGGFSRSESVEVLESATESQNNVLRCEIAGAVINPGVYELKEGDRVNDLLILAGGVSLDADREWMEKYLNRAAKVSDGQKIYIPKIGEINSGSDKQTLGASASGLVGDQSGSVSFLSSGGELVNINTSDQKTLESLTGIGPVYAQKIIEQRPYSNIEELASKKVIPQNTFEKIKNDISVY